MRKDTAHNAARRAQGRATDQRVLDALIELRHEHPKAKITAALIGASIGMKRDTVGSVLFRLKASGAVVRDGEDYVPQRIDAHPEEAVVVVRAPKPSAYPNLREMAVERGWV